MDLRHYDTVIEDRAILIKSTLPVRAVGENQEMYSTDLVLFFPVTSLGNPTEPNEYYAVTWDFDYHCRVLVVTAYDDTKITFTNPTAKGSFTYMSEQYTDLTVTIPHKYQSLQLKTGYPNGFTGLRITSNKPISAYSGNKKVAVSNLYSSSSTASSDHTVEQLLPVNSWGKQYILTPLPFHASNGSIARLGNLLSRCVYRASQTGKY